VQESGVVDRRVGRQSVDGLAQRQLGLGPQGAGGLDVAAVQGAYRRSRGTDDPSSGSETDLTGR
jgi:hypothetical protein